MNLKQKFSLCSAGLLPALALLAYFLFVPVRASAASCPPGEFYAPCGTGGCESGGGTCFGNHTCGAYVFCNAHGGVCNSGCVTCEACN